MRSGDGLGGQLAERDLEPPPRVLGRPPSHHSVLATRDGERRAGPRARRCAARRAASRARRPASPAAACASASRAWIERRAAGAVGQQPQRGGVEAGRGRRRGRLQLARGGAQQRDRRLVARAGGLLDVVGALHRPGAAALERDGRAGVRAEPPAAGRGLVDRVADHRVAEREAPRRPAGPHQRPGEQLVERASAAGSRAPPPPRPGRARTDRRSPRPRRAAAARPALSPAELRRQRGRDGRRDRPSPARSAAAPPRPRASCSR